MLSSEHTCIPYTYIDIVLAFPCTGRSGLLTQLYARSILCLGRRFVRAAAEVSPVCRHNAAWHDPMAKGENDDWLTCASFKEVAIVSLSTLGTYCSACTFFKVASSSSRSVACVSSVSIFFSYNYRGGPCKVSKKKAYRRSTRYVPRLDLLRV